MKKHTIKTLLAFSFFTFSFSFFIFSQNIGINATGAIPNASAMLDVSSTSKGMLIPRMSTADMNAIANPATSLIIFDTTTHCFMSYMGAAYGWKLIACNCCSGPPAATGGISGPTTFCANQAGVTYSVLSVFGATYYNWSLPSGASIASGQGTPYITVNFGSASSGNISVYDSNSCGSGGMSILAITLVPGAPATPGTINGDTTLCSGAAGIVYSIIPVPGATSYTWNVPSGASILSGQGGTSVTITFGSSGGAISVYASNGCGNSGSATLTVSMNPSAPSAPVITGGSSTACFGATGVVYSCSAVANASTYIWTVPSDATITSGQGTTAITVTFGSTSNNIGVYASNGCGNSAATNLPVSVVAPPAMPGAITGPTSSCASAVGITYSVPQASGAISYTWIVPSGSVITSGQGTTSIVVSFGSASGNISVFSTNSCGNSSVQNLAITLTNSVPAVPGIITGAAGVCNNVTSQSYSIGPVIGATSYSWTVPAGATITSGQGTTGITVIYTSNAQSGNITVSASNSCGTSVTSSILPITVYISQTPPLRVGGSNVVATGSTGNIYSIATVPGGIGYNWSISPAGATITSGQGTTSITVNFGGNPTTYAICVYDSGTNSGCNSSASCLTVTSYSCPLHGTLTFSYTGALQNWNVPCSTTQVTAYMWGAGGGSNAGGYQGAGGSGAFAGAVLNVSAATTLNIVVGQGAAYYTSYPNGTYGGGGNNSSYQELGAGGGRSAIQYNGSGTDVLTAGGGGGAGWGESGSYYGNGGGGGNGTNANDGTNSGGCSTDFGIGGTANAGGAGGSTCEYANGSAGTQYQGAASVGNSCYYGGGAGGGGYYGGGSGADGYCGYGGGGGGGGGGGSSYPTSTNGNVTAFISPTTAPVAGNTNPNGTTDNFIYPAEYNVSPFSAFYISGVGTSGTGNSNTSGGNGLVVLIY